MYFRCPYCGINNIWERFLNTICIQNKVPKQSEIQDLHDFSSPSETSPISPFSFSFKSNLEQEYRKETLQKNNNNIEITTSDEEWEQIG